ncbi:hypothetical protein Tco_1441741, partial [Tanacetum coccineum]
MVDLLHLLEVLKEVNPQYALQDQGIFNSGCSWHMTENKSYLTDYQDINGGFVAFAGSPKGVFHSKTKHIEIRHHFIRDSYEKKLVQEIKIYIDHNVADLLTKAFDVSRKAKRTTEISQSSRPIHLVAYKTVYKEWEDRMERAATTASSLEAEQDNVNAVRLNLLMPVLVYAARNSLTAVRHKLMLPGITSYCWFAETHNLVAFLEKPEESNGFEEIIDFLNASYVQYALTVNQTIYTTCIEQFWASAKAKIVNEERQIQALVDKK